MSADPHRPTTAGPTPVPAATAAADAATTQPAGSAAASAAGEGNELPFGIPPDRPEILVGAAFAGGLLAAIILKRFGGD
ncbi:MAG TPA: hypothetical protein VHF51_20595 [Solirubrobacteraceae bacterium]|jgi:hypothetical protein|nr:hypothetical protein [Solirubrobacteraceae bacterium]